MAREWPAFRTLLSNMEMVLAKSDLAIAARYAQLVPKRALRERIFGAISAEHGRTLAMLAADPARAAGRQPHPASLLRERFAYIDPLNYLQIELIRRHRAAQRDPDAAVDERVQRAIHLTINGIAAGLRNSGCQRPPLAGDRGAKAPPARARAARYAALPACWAWISSMTFKVRRVVWLRMAR